MHQDSNNSISDKLKKVYRWKPKECWNILNSSIKEDNVNIYFLYDFMGKKHTKSEPKTKR